MKWIEIITLRSLDRVNTQFLDGLLQNAIKSRKINGHPSEIRIYHNSTVETDLSIHIHWESKAQPARESPLGQQISYAMKGLGLLNHSVWVEAGAWK